ncbi:MAG: SPOR domain-containing protein [Phycisphaerales bacterium]
MITATASRRLVFALLGLLLAAGCNTTPKPPSDSSLQSSRVGVPAELDEAVAAYRAGSYRDAFERARTVGRQASTPMLREQAAWVAGLSAYQSGDLNEAERQFMIGERSTDRQLAGECKVMLGDIRVRQNRMRDASDCYRAAASLLEGEDRRKALANADLAMAQAQSGRGGSAVPSGGGSGAGAATAGGSTDVAAAGETGSFTLQAGAYGSESNARKRASEIAATTRSAGLGDPRVVSTRDSKGRPLWAVQVGSFPSRKGADDARTRVASLGLVVERAG